MTINVRQLAEWLGPQGALAGLEKSTLTNSELMVLARENGLSVDPKMTRRQLAIELVMTPIQRIDKPTEFLLGLSQDELKRYFTERLVSNSELSTLLSGMGISPAGKLRVKLVDYAAREVSELGMFQRVAKGHSDDRKR
jgi:hypothetical protein